MTTDKYQIKQLLFVFLSPSFVSCTQLPFSVVSTAASSSVPGIFTEDFCGSS